MLSASFVYMASLFLSFEWWFLSRKRDDLIMTHTVGITEALCGFQMVFQHLDGRDIVVTHLPGDVRHFAISGEGMGRWINVWFTWMSPYNDIIIKTSHFIFSNFLRWSHRAQSKSSPERACPCSEILTNAEVYSSNSTSNSPKIISPTKRRSRWDGAIMRKTNDIVMDEQPDRPTHSLKRSKFYVRFNMGF